MGAGAVITVMTWLWKQPQSRTEYTAGHVNVWAAMVARNLSMPQRLACVTDMPEGVDPAVTIIRPPGDFEGMQTPRWTNGRPSCFRRLAMFRRDAAAIFGKRFVSMDLDCVVGGRLDPLFDRREDLVIFKGTMPGRPYNGSMVMMRAGCRPHVYDDFTEAGAVEAGQKYVGSDQAWMAHRLGPDEPTWDEADGVYWYGSRPHRLDPKPRLVFFPGQMKPWTAARVDRFVKAHYRIAEQREAA
jgi:hypothetical protein